MGYAMGLARTNFFRVTDEAKFRKWVEANRYELIEEEGAFSLVRWEYTDYTGMRVVVNAEYEVDDEEDFDFAVELAKFLAAGSVAVLFDCGYDSHGSVFGRSKAFDSSGRIIEIDIDDVLEGASHSLGGQAFRAEDGRGGACQQ